jgi:hypothetical protein
MAPVFSIAENFAVLIERIMRMYWLRRCIPEYILNENLPGLEDVSVTKMQLGKKEEDGANQEISETYYQKMELCFAILSHVGRSRERLRRLEKKHRWKFSVGI